MAIINPWIFYLIEVLNGLKEVSVVVIFMTIIMLICIGVGLEYLTNYFNLFNGKTQNLRQSKMYSVIVR